MSQWLNDNLVFLIIPMIGIAIILNAIWPSIYTPSMVIGVAFGSFVLPMIVMRGINERANAKKKRR